jgi:transmembrane sensor
MSERETAEAIEAQAVAWVARLDRLPGDAAAEAELAAWLAGDDRRRGALFRAQVAWRMLDRTSALRGGRATAPDRAENPAREAAIAAGETPGEASALVSRRHVLWGGLAAAGLVGTVGLGMLLSHGPRQRIETTVGEIRRVPLADGSLMAVNTSTQLAVELRPEVRQVDLARGEAWFQVAHDRARPFIVEAGDVRVRAVGTAFSVRRTPAGAEVQVTEGVVEVWSVGREKARRRVAAGSRIAVLDAAGPQAVTEAGAEIDRSLAWRSGQLIFDGDTLGEAVAEFNRYNQVQVRIADPSLASERFVGRFRTNEPDAFARAAATILGARAEIGPDEITLSRR